MKRKKIKSFLEKISNIFAFLLLTLAFVIIFLYFYIETNFYNVTLEQLLFSMQTAEGTGSSMIVGGAIYIIPRLLIVYLILFIFKIVLSKFRKNNINLLINFKKKSFKIRLSPLSGFMKLFLCLLVFIGSSYYVLKHLGVFDYLNTNQDASYIADNYVDPKEVKIDAPREKRNLIYIYVESLESSLFSGENGGDFKESVIPNLEQLALDNISFSNTEMLGGADTPYGTGWTIAGMMATSAGVPLKLPASIDSNQYYGYGSFAPGAYSIGEILEKYDYRNYLLLGSDATFGGRREYFTTHGDYEIYDYNYAKEQNWIDDDYYVWWGYEDKKLYEFAKDELLEIADEDEPFNFTMLTADTHATDGYLEKSCKNPYNDSYLNAYNCTDEMLSAFIKWIQKQDFYDDTTIVITGDHLSMQNNLMSKYNVGDDHFRSRKVVNIIINSAISENNMKNRHFTTFDYYPTTLAALGFKIDGDKLGLGTNLFSGETTLLELSDIDKMNEDLSKNSEFYNNVILGDSYDKLMNNAK